MAAGGVRVERDHARLVANLAQDDPERFRRFGLSDPGSRQRPAHLELYAVFNSPPVLRVHHGHDKVGYIQAGFVQGHDERKGPLCFRLGGRP